MKGLGICESDETEESPQPKQRRTTAAFYITTFCRTVFWILEKGRRVRWFTIPYHKDANVNSKKVEHECWKYIPVITRNLSQSASWRINYISIWLGSIYIVGTEEGPIYKCDRSYSEQYMMIYTGHNGPVYQVRWSPFMPSLFLSCSADWTTRLWSEDQVSVSES